MPSRFATPTLNYALVYWVLLLNSIGVGAFMTLLPSIAREVEIPDTLIASTLTLSAVLLLLTTNAWARLSDRRGRKLVIIFGSCGFTAAAFFSGLGVYIGEQRLVAPLAAFAVIVIGRACYGAMGLASNPAAIAFVADRSSREDRTKALAGLSSAQGVGAIVGPAVTPLLILPYLSLAGPFFVITVVGCISILVVGFALVEAPAVQPSATRKDNPRALWKERALRPILSYTFISSFCFVAQQMTIGFVIIDALAIEPVAAQRYTGVALMGGAAATLFTQLVLVRILRLKPPTLMVAGPVLALTGNIGLAYATSYAAIAGGFVLASFGYALARPGYMAGGSLSVPADRQGEVAGALMSAVSVALIFSPVAFLSVYEISRPAPFVIISVLMAGSCTLALLHPALRNISTREAAA